MAEAHGQLAPDGDATAVDLLAWLQHLALDVASRALLSMPIGAFGARLRQRILDYGVRHSAAGFLDFFLPTSVPSPRDFGRRWFEWRWMRDIDQLVAARMARSCPSDAADLIDLLRGYRDQVSANRFSERELRDQVATLIVAGHETTAVALFWSFYLLALSPQWQELVAKEAASYDLGPEGATTALPSLSVARVVVKEALRLYPPVFIIIRRALTSDRLAGHDVPPGTVVIIAPWVLHRHPRIGLAMGCWWHGTDRRRHCWSRGPRGTRHRQVGERRVAMAGGSGYAARMTMLAPNRCAGHRFPPAITSHAVWLYVIA